MVIWCAACSLFRSLRAPAHPAGTQPASAPAPRTSLPPTTIRSVSIHSPHAVLRKPPQATVNLPPPSSPPPAPSSAPLPPSASPPLVTLGNADDSHTNAQHLLDQANSDLSRVNRAELTESATSAYEQANELVDAAQRAMTDQDYLAASNLAAKAAALTSQLPTNR